MVSELGELAALLKLCTKNVCVQAGSGVLETGLDKSTVQTSRIYVIISVLYTARASTIKVPCHLEEANRLLLKERYPIMQVLLLLTHLSALESQLCL